jgi:hypothetical protein
MQLPAFLEKISWDQIITPAMTSFRRRRLAALVEAYPDLANYRVLDVGGRPAIWNLLKEHYNIEPKQLTLLNVAGDVERFDDGDGGVCTGGSDPNAVDYEAVVGNGCDIPFADGSFDLTFSNSVIEHVGDEANTLKFAQECKRVGQRVYIQTPNRWFPMEPHFVTLFIHWLPRSLYRKVAFLSLYYALFSWRSATMKNTFYEEFDSIRLLTRSQLKRLFPNKRIGREQVLGLTKSFIVLD